jgi:hypothetical protein
MINLMSNNLIDTKLIYGLYAAPDGDFYQSLVVIIMDYPYRSKEYTMYLKYINNDYIFRNNVSQYPIQFNQYYDESIMYG